MTIRGVVPPPLFFRPKLSPYVHVAPRCRNISDVPRLRSRSAFERGTPAPYLKALHLCYFIRLDSQIVLGQFFLILRCPLQQYQCFFVSSPTSKDITEIHLMQIVLILVCVAVGPIYFNFWNFTSFSGWSLNNFKERQFILNWGFLNLDIWNLCGNEEGIRLARVQMNHYIFTSVTLEYKLFIKFLTRCDDFLRTSKYTDQNNHITIRE